MSRIGRWERLNLLGRLRRLEEGMAERFLQMAGCQEAVRQFQRRLDLLAVRLGRCENSLSWEHRCEECWEQRQVSSSHLQQMRHELEVVRREVADELARAAVRHG